MLLSELFIIYFAAAAPFGVSRFLAEHARGAGTRTALREASLVALAWPYTSLKFLLGRAGARSVAAEDVGGDAPDSRAVELATRAAVNALREVEDLLAYADESLGPEARHALFNARGCVERYSGLALACASADAAASPSPREMELCRMAGRAGDDLLVAGRCVHRRNVTRLFAHRERARAELVRALAQMREVVNSTYAARQPFRFAGHTDGANEGRLAAALSHALSRVVELLSLLGDEATKGGVVRLLEEESAGAGRHGSGDGDGVAAQEGEESCMTPTVPTAFATQPLRTRASQGG